MCKLAASDLDVNWGKRVSLFSTKYRRLSCARRINSSTLLLSIAHSIIRTHSFHFGPVCFTCVQFHTSFVTSYKKHTVHTVSYTHYTITVSIRTILLIFFFISIAIRFSAHFRTHLAIDEREIILDVYINAWHIA